MRLGWLRVLLKTWVAVLVCLAVAVAGCSRSGPKSTTRHLQPPRTPIGVTVLQSDTIQTDENGHMLWKVTAAKMTANEADGAGVVSDGSAVVYDNGTIALQVTCPRLKAIGAKRQLHAWGGIQASSPRNNTKFTAKEIRVDLRTNHIRALGGVEGSNNAGTFTADSLDTDIKFSRMRIQDPIMVEGTIGGSK